MRRSTTFLAAALALTGACHRTGGSAAQIAACLPAAASPLAVADLEGLAGSFDLVMVASAGERSGRAATGRLDLRRQAPDRVRDTTRAGASMDALNPLIGSTGLSPEDVGAPRLGDPGSGDAAAPGVALWVSVQRPSTVRGAVFRIGSASNAGGTPGMDAAFFSLRVTRVDAAGFDGEWTTGGTNVPVAGGHACARRRA